MDKSWKFHIKRATSDLPLVPPHTLTIQTEIRDYLDGVSNGVEMGPEHARRCWLNNFKTWDELSSEQQTEYKTPEAWEEGCMECYDHENTKKNMRFLREWNLAARELGVPSDPLLLTPQQHFDIIDIVKVRLGGS